MNSNKLYISLISAFILTLTGCNVEDPGVSDSEYTRGYRVEASIQGFGSYFDSDFDEEVVSTRVVRAQDGDYWSYDKFESGDMVGFYSLRGNMDSENGDGPFENEPMYYVRMSDGKGYFQNTEMNYNAASFVKPGAFFYFPYHENIEYDAGHTQLLDDDYGLELREFDNEIEKCRDFLWVINPSNPTGSQSLAHAFSSIIFLRGEGFKNATDKSIKVVLNRGVSHMALTNNDDYLRNAKLFYLEGYDKSELECRDWYAWPGDPYKVTDKKDENSAYLGQTFDAYYIILPTTRGGDRLSVDHIELYDDDGNLKVVSNFKLYSSSTNANNSKILSHGQQYALVIKMDGLETVVSPVEIEPWGEDNVINETRDVGIEDASDFISWTLAYNTYLSNNRSPAYDDQLKQYGDKTEAADGSSKWTFYILNNLDFTSHLESQANTVQNILAKLDDTLEGYDHEVTGLKLEGSSPSFIGEISETGVIQNLDFKGLSVKSTEESMSISIGGIAYIFKGSLSGCSIDGVVAGPGPVGIIAANAENALVSDCSAQGLIIGSSTSDNGLFGKQSGCSLENNNTSGLIFQSSN